MKATQLEDSDKLMQALETLRNFEGNNLQINEKLNQVERMTTTSLDEAQKNQKQLSLVVKKQLVPFIQKLNLGHKTQSDKLDALIQQNTEKDEVINNLRNEMDQIKVQMQETIQMMGDQSKVPRDF